MPEILGDAGVYFDPEDPRDVAAAIGKLATDEGLRERAADQAYRHAERYSWAKCARDTFSFLEQTYARFHRQPR